MLNFWQEWKKKSNLKKLLLEFYKEVKKNLEAYYVMDQLERLRSFRLERWQKMKDYANITFGEEVLFYIRIIEDYNRALENFKGYEQWYASDVNNKTQENVRTLHLKKQEADQKFKNLDQVIKSVIAVLETRLRAMNVPEKELMRKL